MTRAAILLMCAIVLSTCGGCFGYVMGLSDKEVRRVRQVLAELEAKNAELLEENRALHRELDEIKKGLPENSAERSTEARVTTTTEGVAETTCPD